MARKTLLTEAEVRQFMKLANLGPLGAAKIEEMYGDTEDITEDEELEEKRGRGKKKDDDKLEEDENLEEMGMGAYDRDPEEMGPEDEMGAEAEVDAAIEMDDEPMDDEPMDDEMDMGGIDDGEREELMADVVRAVAQALGIEDQVSVEAGDEEGMEGGDELDADVPAMDAMDEPVDDEPAMAMDDDDDDPMMEEDELDEASDDELVAEVARRVAQRLQAQDRKSQVIDALAERIMNRLTQK